MPKVDVLQVVHALDPGGTERVVIELVSRLSAEFQMAVCCLDTVGAWGARLASLGVPVVALGRKPGFRPSIAWRIAAHARSTGAKLIHSHHYSPFVYARMASWGLSKAAVVFTEHGRLDQDRVSVKRRWINPVLMAGCVDLFAVSHDLRRHLLAESAPARMKVIWNGIDPGRWSEGDRAAARKRLGLPLEQVVVGTVARLDRVKDIRTQIDAVGSLIAQGRDVILAVVGDGEERPMLVERAEAAGLGRRVLWLGQRDDVRALLPAFDVYLNSSLTEGICLAVLEAMAAALPVIATGVGGTPEVVIDGETGILVPPAGRAEMSRAIAQLLDDRRLAAAMGQAGRRRVVQDFSVDDMVEQYADVYRRRLLIHD